MKITNAILIVSASLIMTACGNFEWFPPVSDSTPPVVTAQISGTPNFNNTTTHVSDLSAVNVTFFSNETATIYYTTNGTVPTTASSSTPITNSASVQLSDVTDFVLQFIGIDTIGNQSAVQRRPIASP